MKNIIYLFLCFNQITSLIGDRVEVIDSSGTYNGTLIRHGDMKYTIRTDQGKIKVLKYSETTLSKIN